MAPSQTQTQLTEMDKSSSRGVVDDEEGLLNDVELSDNVDMSSSAHSPAVYYLGNMGPVPISKAPSTRRDALFAVAYLGHFLFVFVLLFLKDGKEVMYDETLILREKAGSWTSILMIVDILSAFIGVIMIISLARADMRESILAAGISLSIIVQVCFGNVLLVLQTRYSFIGLFALISAFSDSRHYSKARKNISFCSAILQICTSIMDGYSLPLMLIFLCILLAQTFALLWWGSFFVGLVSGVSSPAEADLFILVLVGSLCWTVQVYQGLVAYIVGGCVHWHFVQPEGGDGTSPRSRALLHLYCALTVSFGSICKHALLGEGAHWLLDRYDSHVDSNSDDADTNNSLSSQDAEKGQTGRTQVHTQIAPISNSNGPIADLACTRKLVLQARLANRLALPFSATYGTTLAASAEQVYRLHRGSVAIERHDDTHRTLSALAKFGAALIAIVFGLCADTEGLHHDQNAQEGLFFKKSWTIFFLVAMCLSYSGLSLALQVYRAATAALFLAFGSRRGAAKLGKENPIVHLRFTRIVESGETMD